MIIKFIFEVFTTSKMDSHVAPVMLSENLKGAAYV